MPRRVVITARAAVTSLGATDAETMDSFASGRTTFERAEADSDVVVAPVKDFDLRPYTGRFKNRRYLNRGAAFAVAAALAAIEASGTDAGERRRAGLFVGTGPNFDLSDAFDVSPDGRRTPALWLLRFLANTPAAVIAQLGGIHGESLSIQTACAAGLQAMGEAYRKVRDGYLELAFAGAGDSRLSAGAILAYKKARAVFTGPGDPAGASRPFDADRGGFVSGEGGAFFLLESLAHAQTRGARILAEVCGFAASMDAHAMTAPEPAGTWAEAAVRSALTDAAMATDAIDLVSAHGTGTPLNDAVEADLLYRVFGPLRPPVLALKSWIGHLSAACGAVEAALVLACLGKGCLPPIRNMAVPCHGGIDFVRSSRAFQPGSVLIENFGFGGQNCALVLKTWTGS